MVPNLHKKCTQHALCSYLGDLRPWLICSLGIIWWRLINHLRIEWSINPQYGYGWAVPFLSLYLASRELRAKPLPSRCPSPSALRSPLFVVCLLAALWLPIRLVQEANPEWRLVSWALALEAVALTLALFPGQSFKLRFPLLFMLVAVPWPSALEQPVIQALSQLTAQFASEALNLCGLPALQHGNLVEVSSGNVGVEEACSGIRSFQAALMVSLFFCAYYRLRLWAALSLIGTGLLLAIALNIGRTALLALLAATKGMNAVALWHDAAGSLIPLLCFSLVALFAGCLAGRQKSETREQRPDARDQRSVGSLSADLCSPISVPLTASRSPRSVVGLAVWLFAAELATELWYRTHESGLPTPAVWTIALPRGYSAGRNQPLPAKAKQSLRFDRALNLSWDEPGGRSWQAIFLEWKPGRVAARLAKDHTPAICLSAAGRVLLAPVQKRVVLLSGFPLRGLLYSATDPLRGKVQIFYCVREDSSSEQFHLEPASLWQERLAPVFAGRRNRGMRSLELIVWGIQDDEEGSKALLEQVRRIVRLESMAAKQ